MTNRPRAIGTADETAVVTLLRDSGWPAAERRALHGGLDCGDVTGTPGICWEVKGGEAAKRAINQPAQITAWLQETETERRNAHADLGVLIMHRGSFGARNVARWWAVVPWRMLHDLNRPRPVVPTGGYPVWIEPAFVELGTLLPILQRAGYGTQPGEATA